MFAYQQDRLFFAQAARGLDELVRAELEELGAGDIEAAGGGLHFRCDSAGLYRVNYCSRLVSRVLAPLASFTCLSEQALYEAARALDWQALFSVEQTFAVFANVWESRMAHSHYAALRLKDAIADHFRDLSGRRPDVDTERPDVWINLSVRQDRAVISLDTSNGSLHRRGYRVQSVAAPLQETLAAAMVRLSGWQGERPLVDPMCGSGTILAEAFMHYCRVPAAFKKEKFGFESMPDFDPAAWENVRRESDAAIREMPEGLIRGSDLERQAVAAARSNLREIPGTRGIAVERKDFRDLPGIPGCHDHLQPALRHARRRPGGDAAPVQGVRRFPEAALPGLDRVPPLRQPGPDRRHRLEALAALRAVQRPHRMPAVEDRGLLT